MDNRMLINFEDTINEVLKLKEYPESQLIEPIQVGKWPIREILGHLYYWDRFILENMVPNMSDNARLVQFPDHDKHNQEAINYINRFKTVHSLIDEFSRMRRELVNNISSIGNDVKFMIGSGKRKFTTDSFISIFVKHDVHHLNQIRIKLSSNK